MRQIRAVEICSLGGGQVSVLPCLLPDNPIKKNTKKHVFYQMMAGLGSQERKELGLAGYTVRDLRYLTSLLFG